MSTETSTTSLAPLRRVQQVTASQQAGTELNPHYMWCTREFTLSLDCGHGQVRARLQVPGEGDPQFPQRVRCRDCPPSAARPRSRTVRHRPAPRFDPVASALITDMLQAAPDRQDEFLDWVRRHGHYEPDATRRQRGYAAMARAACDAYLPSTDNERAHAVRTAIEHWHEQPGEHARAGVRRAAKRLYSTQRRDGVWFAHRGILEAAKLASPHPNNVEAVVEAPTWGFETRSEWQAGLWSMRLWHKLQRGAEEIAVREDAADVVAECAAEADDTAELLTELVEGHQPRIDRTHLGLCLAMLTAYRTARHQG